MDANADDRADCTVIKGEKNFELVDEYCLGCYPASAQAIQRVVARYLAVSHHREQVSH